jgi:cytochrome c6
MFRENQSTSRRTTLKNPIRVALLALMTTSTFAAGLAQGPDLFKAKCQMCHGPDGSGNTPAGKAMKVPPVASFLKESDADLIAVTKTGKGKMPAYAGKLTDVQIKDIIEYMRTLK